MGAVQIAQIRFALLDLVDAHEREEPNAAHLCVNLCVADQEDQWIQILLGTLNFGYPHSEDPLELLQRCGIATVAKLKLEGFEPNLYATFTYAPCPVEEIARFTDQLLTAVYALPPEGYRLTGGREYLLPDGDTSQRKWYQAMPNRWAPRDTQQGQAGGLFPYRGGLRKPTLGTDLWELASSEDQHERYKDTFWIPPAKDRASLQQGDLAKLLFTMRTEDESGVPDSSTERMWVLVTEIREDGCFLGRLVNQPVGVDSRCHYLTAGSEVPFGTEHVADIHRWKQSDIDDFLENALHRKWK